MPEAFSEIPAWVFEAVASAPRISAADAGPFIAIFAAARRRAEAEDRAVEESG